MVNYLAFDLCGMSCCIQVSQKAALRVKRRPTNKTIDTATHSLDDRFIYFLFFFIFLLLLRFLFLFFVVVFLLQFFSSGKDKGVVHSSRKNSKQFRRSCN